MSVEPIGVRLSRAKGWRLPENTVVVSRPGRWGNPFIVGQDGDAARCVELYALLLGRGLLCLTSKATIESQKAARKYAVANIWRLRGKNLACWCALDRPCHRNILLEGAKHPLVREKVSA